MIDRVLSRFRFSEFVLSPRRRLLLRAGREEPLIPRYFDLLVFLVEHRHEAVHRQVIFEKVWTDVVVSDSALSQAIRTLRRTLGDSSREPVFIRTVARHGYQFVFQEVVEETDDGHITEAVARPRPAPEGTPADPFEPLIDRLTRPLTCAADEEDAREAAELLHGLGTADALKRLGTRPHHASARALLRDTRWDVATAAEVPLFGQPSPFAVSALIARFRLRRAARIAAARWAGAAVGGGVAGATAGAIGGALLVVAPGSAATLSVAAVLAVLGAVSGAAGGAGVGAGLSLAEALVRSRRALAAVAGGAVGGAAVGCAAQFLGRWSLAALVGLHVDVRGCLEGLVLGASAGLGYALATHPVGGGLAAPRGRLRLQAALVTAVACGAGALLLALTGHSLVGGTIHDIAQAGTGSQAILTPLGRLIGEPDFGPLTRALLGTGEGALFGFGVTIGLTRRPSA